MSELRRPNPEVLVTPFDLNSAEFLRQMPGSVIRDMPDRMIASTAAARGLPLATRDHQIQAAGLTVIW